MPTPVLQNEKRVVSFIFGIILLIVSAYLTTTLLLTVFPILTIQPNFLLPGRILFPIYGFSSFLVPVILVYAAILLLMPGWRFSSGILLAGSWIPLFTAAGGERLVKNIGLPINDIVICRWVSGGLIFSTVLAIIAEYLLLLHLADFISSRLAAPEILQQVEPAPVSDEPQDKISEENIPESDSEKKDLPAEKDCTIPIVEVEAKTTSEPKPETKPGKKIETTPAACNIHECPAKKLSAASICEDTALYVDLEKKEVITDLPSYSDIEPTEKTVLEHTDSAVELQKDTDTDIGSVVAHQVEEPAEEPVTDEVPEEQQLTETASNTFLFSSEDEIPEERQLAESAEPIPTQIDERPVQEEMPVDILTRSDETQVPTEEDILTEAQNVSDFDIAEKENFDFEEEEEEDDDDDDDENDDYESDDEDDENVDDDLFDEDDTDEDALPPVHSVPPASFDVASGEKKQPENGSVISAKKRRSYSVPYDILTAYPDGEYWVVDDVTRHAAVALKETLNEFRIEADVTGIRKGPVITMFEILPAPGVKLSRIVGLQDNIALRLAASSVRIVAPIPGKHAVGIEVPNQKRAIVSFRELIEAETPESKKMEIPVVLGKDITGEAQVLDLATTPHLLIAGSTGSGKSVCVNSIILSILYKRSPEDVRLILIDPKIVELKLYNDIRHLLSPVITEPKKAFQSLQYCLCEMERRYALLDGMGVRDIKSYNRRIRERGIAAEKLPYLVVIIDEFADLMATTGKELESTVARLCAMSRAVGIHLVLATQRPSIDVITGLIKANIPSRIAFMVASKMDSRIIIDQVGAEKLLGRGDMLYASATDPFPIRIQGAFVSEEEVERVVAYVKTLGAPEYIDEEIFVDDEEDDGPEASLFSDGEDPLYDKALEIVLLAGKASASYIQRKLKIGYNRAARLVEEMEERGIVGPANGSKPREIIHHP